MFGLAYGVVGYQFYDQILKSRIRVLYRAGLFGCEDHILDALDLSGGAGEATLSEVSVDKGSGPLTDTQIRTLLYEGLAGIVGGEF